MDRGAVIVAGGLAGIVLLLRKPLGAAADAVGSVITGRLSVAQVRDMAERIGARFGVEPLMIRAIVEIESARDPGAYREEAHISDASAGLMQTLLSTAQDMWHTFPQIGNDGIPKPQTWAELFDPETSMYHGVAYLKFLSFYQGRSRSEEFVVRGYNGGPGGATRDYTLGYWDRYLAAKARLAS